MSESLIWWSSQSFITALDFIMMYVLAHALMWKALKIEKKHILVNVFCILATSLAFYFFSPWTGRIINHILIVWMVKKVIKRADGWDLLIIYLASGVIFSVLQGMILVIIGLFYMERVVTNVIAQTLTLFAFLGVCKLWKWHRLFHAIRANVVLKLIFSVLSVLALVIMSIFSFSDDLAHFFFSVVAIILVGVVLSPIFVQIYQKVMGIISIEDIKTDLFATAWEMMQAHQPESHYKIYAELAKQYGVDVASFPEDKRRSEAKRVHMETMNKKIEQLIEAKLKNSEKELESDLDITYYEECKNVSFENITHWLNILLEHALIDSINHPIYIYMFSMADSFSLKVASEYPIKKWQSVQDIFEQTDLVNEEMHHIKLHDLYTEVTKLDGKVLAEPFYMCEYGCHYLQIIIELKKEDVIS